MAETESPALRSGASRLRLDPGQIRGCHDAAERIAQQVNGEIEGQTTVSIERTVLRFAGIDGATASGVPLVNAFVDQLVDSGTLGKGAAYWLGRALASTGNSPQRVARAVACGDLKLAELPPGDLEAVRAAEGVIADSMRHASDRCAARHDRRAALGESPPPHKYVLSATGNVYDDIVHALAIAQHGGDIVAMIRSTAQSLLDFVPYGPTTEGYGGTFVTQANFRLLRQALDEWCDENGRYVRLSSFCSGLCMPEIAAIGAMEGLDNMVIDAMYGILYRDIHGRRTLTDQRFARRLNGHFGVVLNTGEDNYLRTADPISAAPSVVASQFINYKLARACDVPDELIGLGGACEINPDFENGLLYEWAQASLSGALFPNCPVKYMPPTRYMDGDAYRTQACDTLFNLIAVASGQLIQTIGAPTEGSFTPHIRDKVVGLQNATYVARYAGTLGDEIEFKPGGIIETRASDVLAAARQLLEEIADVGLRGAIMAGAFGDVFKDWDEGRGSEGLVSTHDDYLNPCLTAMGGSLP